MPQDFGVRNTSTAPSGRRSPEAQGAAASAQETAAAATSTRPSLLAKFRRWLPAGGDASQWTAGIDRDRDRASPAGEGSRGTGLLDRLLSPFRTSPGPAEREEREVLEVLAAPDAPTLTADELRRPMHRIRKAADEHFNKAMGASPDSESSPIERDAALALQSIVEWAPSGNSRRMTDLWRKAFFDHAVRVAEDWSGGELVPGTDPFSEDEELILASAVARTTTDMQEMLVWPRESFHAFLHDAGMADHPLRRALEAAARQEGGVMDRSSPAVLESQWQHQFDRCLETAMVETMRQPEGTELTPEVRQRMFDRALALMAQR